MSQTEENCAPSHCTVTNSHHVSSPRRIQNSLVSISPMLFRIFHLLFEKERTSKACRLWWFFLYVQWCQSLAILYPVEINKVGEKIRISKTPRKLSDLMSYCMPTYEKPDSCQLPYQQGWGLWWKSVPYNTLEEKEKWKITWNPQ